MAAATTGRRDGHTHRMTRLDRNPIINLQLLRRHDLPGLSYGVLGGFHIRVQLGFTLFERSDLSLMSLDVLLQFRFSGRETLLRFVVNRQA